MRWPDRVVWVGSPGEAFPRAVEMVEEDDKRSRPCPVRVACAVGSALWTVVSGFGVVVGVALCWILSLVLPFGFVLLILAGATGSAWWTVLLLGLMVGGTGAAVYHGWQVQIDRRDAARSAVRESWERRTVSEIRRADGRISRACLDAARADADAKLSDPVAASVSERIEASVQRATDPVRKTIAARFSEPDSILDNNTGRVAYLRWWHQHDGLVIRTRARVRAYAAASRALFWAHRDFVVICEPPLELHVEQTPDDAYLIHNDAGPAVRWPNGTQWYVWRGVHVPESLIRDGWTVDQIFRHNNSEVCRAAIERMGWLTYVAAARLREVASAPDPGNPPHRLVLYEVPSLRDTRVLMMTNGSPDASGNELRYAETVPASFDDPVAAAAWQYDCPVEMYRRLARRT